MPTNYAGQLNTNLAVGALFNQIVNIRTFSDNIGEMFSSLVDRARVDGGMYGDTRLYISLDIPATHKWTGDNEASNLLALNRPKAPKTQAIVIDQFRQVFITIDEYLTKQAFASEGAFAAFNATVVATMRDAKRVYDTTLWNSFVGTAVSEVQSAQDVAIDETAVPSLAQGAGAALAKLLIRIKDNSRDFNDYGFMRAKDPSKITVIWNADYVVDLKKYDLPAIFHDSEIVDKFGYENALPGRFFGEVLTEAGTADGETVRTLVETTIGEDDDAVEYFPGDLLPKDTAYNANEAYKEDSDVIAIVTGAPAETVPFMSGFEVGTNFFNARSLTQNQYITWGHNTLERIADQPWVRITKKAA